MPKSTPGIRREHVDRTAADGRVELVDAFLLGEVEVEGFDDLRARLTSRSAAALSISTSSAAIRRSYPSRAHMRANW
ncbi:hypothetical protein ABIB99_006576 [Bradyrhizobium sp. LA6.1]